MINKFKAACIQNCTGDDVMKNINDCIELTRAARDEHADLICLPEFFTYLHSDNKEILKNAFTEDLHPAITSFSALAKELNVWILLGSLAINISPNKINNRSYLINPNGSIVARYDKLHLFDVDLGNGEKYLESEYVLKGEKPVQTPTPWGTMGMTICYDLRFAYLYRKLAQQGACFFTIPAAFTKTTGEAHWHVLNRARAIETGSYVIAPCQCGEHPGGRFTYGHSLIIDPWGTILAEAGDEPSFIVAEIDIQKVDQARSKIPALQHDRKI